MTLCTCLFWTQRQIDQLISDAGPWAGGEYKPQSHPFWGYFEVNHFVLEDVHCSASEFVATLSRHAYDLLVRYAKVCVFQIPFGSFAERDWLWHSLVLGLCVAEAGLILRLLLLSVQSSRRLHLTLSLPWRQTTLRCAAWHVTALVLTQWWPSMSMTWLPELRYSLNLETWKLYKPLF